MVLRASRKERQGEIRHVKFRRMGEGLEGRMGLVAQVPHWGKGVIRKVTGKGTWF